MCSVIIVNYNGRLLLERFLPSVEKLDYENYEVIVVDNASSDDSRDFLKNNYPHFKLVESSINTGTAEGSNIGVPAAQGEYILWLSNDMELDSQLLRELVKTAESSSKIGICTCKMRRITPEGRKLNIIDSVGGDLDIFGFPAARGVHQTDFRQLDETQEVFFSFGGAMLIKKKVIDAVGGYDPAFFTLADDIDLCWRARLAGYSVVAQPKAILYHRVSATLGRIFSRNTKRYMAERNTLRMLLKNYSTGTLLSLIPRYLGLLLGEIIFYFMLGRIHMATACLRALLWNIRRFGETWKIHYGVQQLRKLNDKEIQQMMLKKPIKIGILKEVLAGRESEFWRTLWQRYLERPLQRSDS